MTLSIPRRAFISGLASLIAAPAVIRVAKLMPISVEPAPYGIGPAMRAIPLLEEHARQRFMTIAQYAKLMDEQWKREFEFAMRPPVMWDTGEPIMPLGHHVQMANELKEMLRA